MPQRLTLVTRGEMELKAGGKLAEACADLDQAQAQGIHLDLGGVTNG